MRTAIPCKITYSETDKCLYVEYPGFYDGIMTYGDTLDSAKAMAAEAVTGLLETYLEYGDTFSIPPKEAADWYDIEIPPSLAFAMWLRNASLSRNMTLADVADKMGVKYQVYQKLEPPILRTLPLKRSKNLNVFLIPN
jgi:antitoxin HicB